MEGRNAGERMNGFFAAGKSVISQGVGRMLRPGRWPAKPTASVGFLGAFLVDSSGTWVCQPNGSGYQWELVAGKESLDARYVNVSGDAMTGALVVQVAGAAATQQQWLNSAGRGLTITGADPAIASSPTYIATANSIDVLIDAVSAIFIDSVGNVIVNESGADRDFRVESDTDPNAFFINAGANTARVGSLAGTGTRVVTADSAGVLSASAAATVAALIANPTDETLLYVNTGSVTTNASTVTYQTFLTTTKVLPAGTWSVKVLAALTLHNGTSSSGAEARISSPGTGTARATSDPTANGRFTLFCDYQGSVVSDGSTPITFTAEYRAVTSGTAATNTGVMVGLFRRTA